MGTMNEREGVWIVFVALAEFLLGELVRYRDEGILLAVILLPSTRTL